MKNSIALLIVLAGALATDSTAISQTNQWTWMSGPNTTTTNDLGDYPYLRISGGKRYASFTQFESTGWMFGGMVDGNEMMNDLWKCDLETGFWIWMSGSASEEQNATYGTQGQSSATTVPGARVKSVAWTDTVGNIWIFGGEGRNASGTVGYLNDLWKFDVSTEQWTWMSGSNMLNQNGTYGTQGTGSVNNIPGGRYGSCSWTDLAGNFWLFGGFGRGASGATSASLNDLWKYDVLNNEWTWVKGSNNISQSGTYGTQGTAATNNIPGARIVGAQWLDSNGLFWMFGGLGLDTGSATSDYLNDLWRYNPSTNEWTWMKGSYSGGQNGTYGTQGTAAASNTPGSREQSSCWIDSLNNLWLFGGSKSYLMNDLWKYSPTSNMWTWVKGSSNSNGLATYGTKGQPSNSNVPGSRISNSNWIDSEGNFFLFSGYGHGVNSGLGYRQDLWRYNPSTNQWTWMNGLNTSGAGYYGTKASVLGRPMSRYSAASWVDSVGNFWLFGGDVPSTGSEELNDLWKYIPAVDEWHFIGGSGISDVLGIYGTQGTAASTNWPGSRKNSTFWKDNDGNFWLFGGRGCSSTNYSSSFLNDLWNYNVSTNEWTWVKGSSSSAQSGTYGTQGTAASTNTPGAREHGSAWSDSYGNLWLHGGWGLGSSTGNGHLSDLWKYNISSNQWAWVKGGNGLNAYGNYGTMGNSNSANLPGARNLTHSWIDTNGLFWLFGGVGIGGSSASAGKLSDLWKFNPSTNQWTWVRGYSTTDEEGIYSSVSNQGTAHPYYQPGGRCEGNTWVDNNGNFWLFGGNGYSTSSSSHELNDLWRYTPATNQWAWIKGGYNSNTVWSSYGTQGVSATSNTPGKRILASSWQTEDGIIWLYGGLMTGNGPNGRLTDLWRFVPNTCAGPLNTTSASNQNICIGNSTTLSATGVGTLKWYATATSTTVLSTGSTFNTSTLSSNTTYYVSDDQCLAAGRLPIVVSVGTIPTVSISINPSSGQLCQGQQATLTATGGISYAWNAGVTNGIPFVPSSSTTYTVTVTSSSSCTATGTAYLFIVSSVPTLGMVVENVSCHGFSNGSSTANVTGGTSPFSFAWSNSVANTTNSGLTAGTYSVIVTDSNGCTDTASVTITQPDSLIVAITSLQPTCSYSDDGSLGTNVTGGTMPYVYSWSNSDSASAIVDLFEGSYALTVADSNGCEVVDSLTLISLSHLVISIDSVSDVLCHGDTSGYVLAQVTDGVQPYSYSWSNGGTTASQLVMAGLNLVTVTDSLGCMSTDSALVQQPDSLNTSVIVTDETCEGDSNGSISATVMGGVMPYAFVWSDGQTIPLAMDLAPGAYTLTVTDNHNCTQIMDTVIAPGNPLPQPNLGADTIVTTGLAIVLNPGTYASYIWQDSTTDSVFTATVTGTYSVSVFDSIGCMGADTIEVVIWPTGISTIGNNTLIVYPNPNLGAFTLEWTGEASDAELHDIAGRIIWKGQVTNGKNAIHLTDPRAGVYMLRLQNNEQTINQRVVVE